MGEERRKSKRTDVDAIIELNALANDGETSKREVEVDITDISSGGIAFTSSEELQIDGFFDTLINIKGCGRFKAVIQIVRAVVNSEKKNYSYGGRFVGMNEDDKFKISVFQIVHDKEEKDKEEKDNNNN